MPYPCCGPHCSVCRMSMSSVPCSSSIRFLYWSFSFIDVDTLLALGVECLLPRHGGPSMQSRAYSNSSDEIGIRPNIPVEAVRGVAWVSTKEWVLALERGELDGPAREKEKADIARFNNTVA